METVTRIVAVVMGIVVVSVAVTIMASIATGPVGLWPLIEFVTTIAATVAACAGLVSLFVAGRPFGRHRRPTRG